MVVDSVSFLYYELALRYYKLAFNVSCSCVITTRSRGYKTVFMLNSAEHEILNAHKCENIKKFGIFQDQISLECYISYS